MEIKSSIIKQFLEKYTGKCFPDQCRICKKYVSTVYENTISCISSEIGDRLIWVLIDEIKGHGRSRTILICNPVIWSTPRINLFCVFYGFCIMS